MYKINNNNYPELGDQLFSVRRTAKSQSAHTDTTRQSDREYKDRRE